MVIIKKIVLTDKSFKQKKNGFFSFYTDSSQNKEKIKKGVINFFKNVLPGKKVEIEKINTIINKPSIKRANLVKKSKSKGKKKEKKIKKVLVKFSENYDQEISKIFSSSEQK